MSLSLSVDASEGTRKAVLRPMDPFRMIFSLSESLTARYLRFLFLWSPLITLNLSILLDVRHIPVLWPKFLLIATLFGIVGWMLRFAMEVMGFSKVPSNLRWLWALAHLELTLLLGIAVNDYLLGLSSNWFGWPVVTPTLKNWWSLWIWGSFLGLLVITSHYLQAKNPQVEAKTQEIDLYHVLFPYSGGLASRYPRLLFLWGPFISLVLSVWMDVRFVLELWPQILFTAWVVIIIAWLMSIGMEAFGLGRDSQRRQWFWTLFHLELSLLLGLETVKYLPRSLCALFGWPPHPMLYYFNNSWFLMVSGSLLGLILYWINYLQEKNLRAEAKVRDMVNQQLQAQLAAIRSQLNPHFLFNTLNTLADWVHTNPSRAEWMMRRLSDLFSDVMAATQKEYHPLSLELEICRAYLDLEQARFREKLQVEFSPGQGLDPRRIEVPVLLLQPLVENAVKHGISQKPGGGRVKVKCLLKDGTLEIIVEDDGVGFGQSSKQGSGTALKNLRTRLNLTYGTQAVLAISSPPSGGTRVSVQMPLKINPSGISQ